MQPFVSALVVVKELKKNQRDPQDLSLELLVLWKVVCHQELNRMRQNHLTSSTSESSEAVLGQSSALALNRRNFLRQKLKELMTLATEWIYDCLYYQELQKLKVLLFVFAPLVMSGLRNLSY